MVKHSYIILPAPDGAGKQTIVSLTIHGEAPKGVASSPKKKQKKPLPVAR